MLKINPLQIETLSTARGRSLQRRLIEMLNDSFPESRKVTESDMNSSIDNLVQKATKYGLQTEEQMGVYVTVAWMMGMDFDTRNQAPMDVLPSLRYTADEKCEWLREWVEKVFSSLDMP